MDLICHRYPNRRPSDYLELDEWSGFQLDSALALKADRAEKELLTDIISAIRDDLKIIMRGLGVKVKETRRPKREPIDNGEIPPLEEVLASLGGQGVVLAQHKK